MPLTDDILQAARGGGEAFSKASADTDGSSGGQRWPEDGDHDVWLKDVDVNLDAFRYAGNEIPGIACTFSYETMNMPDGENFTFDGATFRFPQNLDSVKGNLPTSPSNTRARVEIEMNRFKGHCSSLLGHEPASFEQGLSEVVERIDAAKKSGNPIGVSIKVLSNTRTQGDRQRTYRKEHIGGVLSVATS